ncbi:EamA family transporter [Micromonospora krabiensis]|uniref:O-acetylserine/cysteine efflux transporter n=1 Tax=Micromonospora krabiensis TaxID=307121 RepID=A0A1C3N787_9ACTN|nr:EamA family transporter [Micromonospora krabiensis]SBV28454.1 O-acetylserine/cysteine efflux transporter [Micromonospora krabiensis]
MRMSHRLQAVLVAAIWGVNFVVVEVGLRDLPPLVLTALRFVVVAVPLVFFVPRPTARARYVIAYGLVLGVLKFGVLFSAMALGMGAGLASLVLQAQALASVVLAALLLRERPARRQIAGVLVGSAGIGVLAASGGGHTTAIGFALTLFAAASWAVANIVVRASGETRPISLLVWSSLVPPLPLFGLAAVVDGPQVVLDSLLGLSWQALAAIGYVAYVSTLVGFGLWNHLIGRYSVARIAPFSLLVPVFGLTASWLFLGERMTGAEAVAALIVLVGLALVIGGVRPPRPTAPDPAASPSSVAAPSGVTDAVRTGK